MKLIYILIIITAALHLNIPVSYAFDLTVQPAEVNPGDVFLVTLKNASELPAKAEYRNNRINLYPAGEGLLITLVPVDINTPPDDYRITALQGDTNVSASVTVRSHEFKTIHLTLPEEKVTLSPDNQKRVEQEYLLQKNIWDKVTALAWRGSFTDPTGTEISTEFGVKRIMNKKKTSVHRGTDFRGKTGTPVKSLNFGTVVLAKDLFYGGNTLIVDHGMGLYSVYMHLSGFNVTQGSSVEKGEVIGFIGSSGRVTGPHLHLSVKLNGNSINPESLFKLPL